MCGQLGNGTHCGDSCADDQNNCGTYAPTPTHPSTSGVQIGAGAEHTCVLTDSGGITCWGRNGFGQVSSTATSVLGVGDRFVEVPVPTLVQHASSLAVGAYHACAITDSDVRCFGHNDSGQLGNGTTDPDLVASVKWQ
jgi:alpha-tubulin suppressor-like RCC1 family protein